MDIGTFEQFVQAEMEKKGLKKQDLTPRCGKDTTLGIGVEEMFFMNRKLVKRISVSIVGILVLSMVIGAVASYL